MKFVVNGEVMEVSGGGGGGVPAGVIVIWSGTASDIPSGWALCDGQDGRPDLRDRFVLGGGGTHTVGDSGGEETHTLTVEEMPAHTHKIIGSAGSLDNSAGALRLTSIFSSTPFQTETIAETGGSQPHNNMPPYYVLCYIIKL